MTLFTFFNRGLDVQPKSLEKFVQNNDPDSAAILEIIFREEITHVAAGLRWFTWMCSHSNPPLVPVHQNDHLYSWEWKSWIWLCLSIVCPLLNFEYYIIKKFTKFHEANDRGPYKYWVYVINSVKIRETYSMM